jgi:predicted ATPase
LTEGAVEEYLTARFAGNVLPHGLPRLVHQRTEGNPLFMVNVVDAWEAEGWLEEREGEQGPRPGLNELVQGVPESLRQMLLQQFERLGLEEQRVLEAASVAGVECSAAAVAAGLGIDVIEAETWCEGLARRQQWLRAIGSEEWPDGTVAGRYAFIHALYHDVVYQRITAARRIHLHRGIGASKAKAYGPRAGEIAAELAVHFEHGRDYHQAVQYLQRAAETANQRHAQREAIEYLRRALGSAKNSRCSWPSVQRSWSPRGSPPQRWRTPMPGRASCVSTWEITGGSSPCSSGCGGLRTYGRSCRPRVHSGSSS